MKRQQIHSGDIFHFSERNIGRHGGHNEPLVETKELAAQFEDLASWDINQVVLVEPITKEDQERAVTLIQDRLAEAEDAALKETASDYEIAFAKALREKHMVKDKVRVPKWAGITCNRRLCLTKSYTSAQVRGFAAAIADDREVDWHVDAVIYDEVLDEDERTRLQLLENENKSAGAKPITDAARLRIAVHFVQERGKPESYFRYRLAWGTAGVKYFATATIDGRPQGKNLVRDLLADPKSSNYLPLKAFDHRVAQRVEQATRSADEIKAENDRKIAREKAKRGAAFDEGNVELIIPIKTQKGVREALFGDKDKGGKKMMSKKDVVAKQGLKNPFFKAAFKTVQYDNDDFLSVAAGLNEICCLLPDLPDSQREPLEILIENAIAGFIDLANLAKGMDHVVWEEEEVEEEEESEVTA